MPMPKPVCRTKLYNKIVQLEVCRTFSGRGMSINGTAHILLLIIIIPVPSPGARFGLGAPAHGHQARGAPLTIIRCTL